MAPIPQILEKFEWDLYYKLKTHPENKCIVDKDTHRGLVLAAQVRKKAHMRLPDDLTFWGEATSKRTYGTTPTNPSIITWVTSAEVEDMPSNMD